MNDRSYFWLLTGMFIVPVVLGLPMLWIAAYLAALAIAAVFVIPLYICRYCPEWKKDSRVLTCVHYGIPKLYSCRDKLGRVQQILIPLGFVAIYGSGVVMLAIMDQWSLAACAGYATVLWYFTMRRTVCRSCVHEQCPMKG